MENRTVRRRGKPNRGGGRFNRGRGRGSRGRGRQPEPEQPVQHHGHGGRKGGADFMYDYDDGLDDDYQEDFTPQTDQASRQVISNKGNDKQTFSGRRGGRGGGHVKVTMQKLQMSTENQEMVKGMLRDLHGEEIEITSEDEYEELDYRAENQYWMANKQLNIEGATAYAHEKALADESSNMSVSSLAVNKLARYGFHRTRSTEALQLCDGDIGVALEYLLSQCFHLRVPTSTDIEDDELSEIQEQRQDEMTALEAIYEDRFFERVVNKVWILKFSLPALDKIIRPVRETREVNETQSNRELCRFFVKGFCKFGKRCRLSHSVPKFDGLEESPVTESSDDLNYEVEIRFPAGNRYPKEPPFIAFSTTSSFLPHHVCLNITKHMLTEAKSLAEASEPSVFTVVSCLDDETFLESVVKESPHEFSVFPHSKPWVRNGSHKSMGENVVFGNNMDFNSEGAYSADLSKQTETLLRMTENESTIRSDLKDDEKRVTVKRQISRDMDLVKANPAEILKQNRKLVDEFKQKQNSKRYQNMQSDRKNLPAWSMQDEILATIEQNQVVVISGMTGCGKTTQVPQFILDLYLNSGDLHICNILCTQPRRISAMAVAERVSEERADSLGRIVGYQIRLEKMQSPFTRLLFCTTGIVLRRLEGDVTLDGVTHLIIDEVHERSEESDFLLMYLRDMLPQRPDLKVILMSATMNAALFQSYFGGCPVVDIPGKTFPVDQYFLEDAVEFTRFIMEESSPYARPVKHMNAVRRGLNSEEADLEDENLDPSHVASDRVQDQNLSVKQLFLRYSEYRKSTVRSMALMDHTKINYDLVLELMSWLVTEDHADLEFPESGAILVFMPGYAEIQTLFDMLQSSPVFGVRFRHKYKIIPLHSTLSSEDQHAVFSRPPEGVTKIVIATNIAETSITIDDVVFVIDTGKMKEKRYDPTKGMEILDTVWVSRANALQREGRAGRVTSGVCFHLFSSHRFEHHLQEQPVPEIQRAPLEQIILRIKILDIFKRKDVQAVLNKLPEPPEAGAISSAVTRLENLGALEDGELTPLGYHLGSLPVDVRIGKLMLFGAIFRCLDSALTIAACLSFKSPFVAPFGKKHEATEKKLEFAAGNSDHLTMLNAYRGWLEARKNSFHEAYRFCQDNFLSQRSLQMLSSMKQQFVELLSDIGFVKEGIVAKDVERAARSGGDGIATITGEEANLNSTNWKLVSAVLVGALYPNVVQVLTPESKYAQTGGGAVPKAPKADELRFKTKPDGYIVITIANRGNPGEMMQNEAFIWDFTVCQSTCLQVKIHPSSVNFQVGYFESPYLVYHEKVKTTRIYIRDCTMVSVYPLLLFGGGHIAVDLSRGNFILSVDDGWIRFMADSHQVAELVRELRLELDQLLSDKIENPHLDLCTCPRGSKIIATIVKLITTQ